LAAGVAALLTGALVLIAQPAFAAGPAAVFARTSSWATGFDATYTITNTGPAALTTWTVAFDLPAGTTISSSWDSVRTVTGNHYSFADAGWNAAVPVGGSASFGFVAAGSGDPSNCTVNGVACGGGAAPGPDAQAPTVPGGLRVAGSTASSISVSWTASADNVGVTGYEVQRDNATTLTTTSTSLTDSGLAANSTHTYRVRARDAAGNLSAFSATVSGTATGTTTTPPGLMAAAPYIFPGFGAPIPNPATVISATGIRWFTMAFVLANGCNPVWDGEGGLTGGQHPATINAIRAAGGDLVPSFGGFNGPKLGPACGTPEALAAAYLRVVDQFSLKAIDIDIESFDEFENDAVRNRIIAALKIVKQQRPTLTTIVTIPSLTTGLSFFGGQLVTQAAATQANIDIFTIMPFDFGGGANMFQNTVNAAQGLNTSLRTAFGWTAATAFSHMGISGMNGLSDQQELTSTATWTQIRDFANTNHLARLSFWGVNRDRACPGGGVTSSCSGIAQNDWDFTRITAGFRP
jgi:hypothetical protein